MKKVIKLSFIWLLALPLLLAGCKKEELAPAKEPIIYINIDTLSPEAKAVQYWWADVFVGIKMTPRDTLFPLPLDSLMAGSRGGPIGIKISPKPDSGIFVLSNGDTLPGNIKNEFKLIHYIDAQPPYYQKITGYVSCWFNIKRFQKADSLVYRKANVSFDLFTYQKDTVNFGNRKLWVFNDKNPSDSIYLYIRPLNEYPGDYSVQFKGASFPGEEYFLGSVSFNRMNIGYESPDFLGYIADIQPIIYREKGKLRAQIFISSNKTGKFIHSLNTYSEK